MRMRELYDPTWGDVDRIERERDHYLHKSVAQQARAEAAESRVADLEAGIRALADEAKPGLSKMCTCPYCEDDESPIWHDGTPIAWTLDPASLRALVGNETTRSEATS